MIGRRARDANGQPIEPMSLGNMRALGLTRVLVWCVAEGCGYEKAVAVSEWPDAAYVPDVGRRLKCPKCGATELDRRPDWAERKAEERM